MVPAFDILTIFEAAAQGARSVEMTPILLSLWYSLLVVVVLAKRTDFQCLLPPVSGTFEDD